MILVPSPFVEVFQFLRSTATVLPRVLGGKEGERAKDAASLAKVLKTFPIPSLRSLFPPLHHWLGGVGVSVQQGEFYVQYVHRKLNLEYIIQ